MKRIITYGTFDLLHVGHTNLLKRAKELGDYLIVGVTSDAYDRERGKLNVHDSLLERVQAVRETGLADEVIVEEFEGQKIIDIEKYDVDVFAIGSDWAGKFDYLSEYCEVVYLERTRGVSSTMLRNRASGLVKIGIAGTGRIANRFVAESRFVSGIELVSVFNPHKESANAFISKHEIAHATDDYEEMLEAVDAVYIATPHQTHHEYTMTALRAGVHVLSEKPMALHRDEIAQEYRLARESGLALMHAVKTAYCPAFEHLVVLAKSGRIGRIVDVDATFTKIEDPLSRELRPDGYGGSVRELAAYPLLAVAKLLGTEAESIDLLPIRNSDGVDIFTRGVLRYPNATASFKVGLGAKSEGSLVVAGTSGYIYVPAPWWKTEYFEMRFEDSNARRRYYYSFDGDGLRYELLEFARLMREGLTESTLLSEKETSFIVSAIELAD